VSSQSHTKPFSPKWFWDLDYKKIDWQVSYRTVISRILERGGEAEWQELIRFYGKDKIIKALQEEITYLPDYTIGEVCGYFGLLKEDLLCHHRKRLRQGGWI